MKWIKHMTATRRDEKIARLIAKHGMAAYGLYWSIQEIIAEQMEGPEPSCSVSYPVSIWAHQLSMYAPQAEKQLQWMADAGLMEVQRNGDEIVVTNRNLLKYRDEYSRKSGHTPDKLPSKSGREVDKEADIDTEQKKTSCSERFNPRSKHVPECLAPDQLAGTLPLVDGTSYEISKSQLTEWSTAFPAVGVRQQLLEMKAWLNANPQKRKTRSGAPRFIIAWLGKEQDRGGMPNGGTYGTRSLSSYNKSKTAGNFDEARAALSLLVGKDTDDPSYSAAGECIEGHLTPIRERTC